MLRISCDPDDPTLYFEYDINTEISGLFDVADTAFLACSDGTVLEVSHLDGVWSFLHREQGTSVVAFGHDDAGLPTASVCGAILWVVPGVSYMTAGMHR